MPKLAVNIDHIATIREARKTFEPDPIAAAIIVEQALADGLVVHLRQDRRHIQDRDVDLITRFIRIPLNLEMAATESMIQSALNFNPHTVTLVPENVIEVTTTGGLKLQSNHRQYQDAIQELKKSIPEVSLFIDPDQDSIRIAHDIGADSVELHTGIYAEATTETERLECLHQLKEMAQFASENHMVVRAGHGLTYFNVSPVAQCTFINELSIGHSIVARAVFTGLHQAIQDMLKLVLKP